MSMDKSIALSSTVSTRGPQVKNAKIAVPRPWELKYEPVHGQTDSAEYHCRHQRSPSEKYKNEVPRAWELEYEHVHGQIDSAE